MDAALCVYFSSVRQFPADRDREVVRDIGNQIEAKLRPSQTTEH
jgi:hypothetical protein